MSPLEILDGLRSSDASLRAKAAAELTPLLTRLASKPVPTGRRQNTHLVLIPATEREDIVAEVVLRIIRGIEVRERNDGAATEYLKKMLGRNWLTRLKRMRREPVGPTDTAVADVMDRSSSERERDESVGAPIGDEVPGARALVKRVMGAALEAMPPRYRDEQSKVFGQLIEITFENADFRSVIERDDPRGETERETAEAAAYKRHQRARDRLFRTIPLMVEAGRLTVDEARITDRIVREVMVRCQRSTPRGVQESERSGAQHHE